MVYTVLDRLDGLTKCPQPDLQRQSHVCFQAPLTRVVGVVWVLLIRAAYENVSRCSVSLYGSKVLLFNQ